MAWQEATGRGATGRCTGRRACDSKVKGSSQRRRGTHGIPRRPPSVRLVNGNKGRHKRMCLELHGFYLPSRIDRSYLAQRTL